MTFSFNNKIIIIIIIIKIIICHACDVKCQVEYKGEKHYRDDAGVVLSLTDAKAERNVSKGVQSAVINNLVPKTPYLFHIRARFFDGTWGPRARTQSETLADGMFDLCFLFLYIHIGLIIIRPHRSTT